MTAVLTVLGVIAGVASAVWVLCRFYLRLENDWEADRVKFHTDMQLRRQTSALPLEVRSIEDLLDMAIYPQYQLRKLEHAICKRLDCRIDDGSDTSSAVSRAVRDGHGWGELIALGQVVRP